MLALEESWIQMLNQHVAKVEGKSNSRQLGQRSHMKEVIMVLFSNRVVTCLLFCGLFVA